MNGIIGKKIGMTQVFEQDGRIIPVTVIQAGPCVITQIKTMEKEGYCSVQLGFDDKKEKHCSKPLTGHFQKSGVTAKKFLKEIKITNEETEKLELSAEVKISDVFSKGQKVKVTGRSKGRGFTGVMKRWNFGGGRDSHGAKYHRKPFSIGMHTDPGRVFKNKKMPGHYGDEQITTRGLEVVEIDLDKNLLILKGAIPGAKNGYVFIRKDQ